jgi:hypothetical protein
MLCAAGILLMAAGTVADVPKQINHQGIVSVNGVRFDGTGLFRFAIVDPDAPVNLWSNDGSITDAIGGIPTAAVSLDVVNGVYSVSLGDTALANMTEQISSAVFDDDSTVLRIWFDDGVNGNEQLTPDHKLSSSPYAHRVAAMPPIGSIIAWHKDMPGVPGTLPAGWLECNGQVVSDSASPLNGQALPDLNGSARFLRGSTASGTTQDDTFADHQHTSLNGHDFVERQVDIGGDSCLPGSCGTETFTTVTETGNALVSNSAGSETRPDNMSVVWIMRVK